MQKALSYLLSLLSRESLEALIISLAGKMRRKGELVTEHSRPLRPGKQNRFQTWRGQGSTAFVIQGPVLAEDDFTLESLKLYANNYPDVDLILSTWEGTEESILAPIRDLGVKIVLSSPPAYPGNSNFNYQHVSTKAGLDRAKEEGVDYILKTRTDQRFYGHDLVAYMQALIRQFPVEGTSRMKGRLVAAALDSFKYRLYSISDMFLFGHAQDVALMWDVPPDSRPRLDLPSDILNWSKGQVCEVYLVVELMRKLGREPNWTLADSWKTYRDLFCIVDNSVLDLYWGKYQFWKEYRYRSYGNELTNEELAWKDWLLLYMQGVPAMLEGDRILNLNFGTHSAADLESSDLKR